MATPGGFLWQPLPQHCGAPEQEPRRKVPPADNRAATGRGPPTGAACCLSQQNPEECPRHLPPLHPGVPASHLLAHGRPARPWHPVIGWGRVISQPKHLIADASHSVTLPDVVAAATAV